MPRIIRLDDKGALLGLRGVLFVLLTFYVIYSPAQSESLALAPLAVVFLQLLSIIALLFVRPEWFQRGLFLGGIFLLDIGVVSWTIHASRASGTDLYLCYFLVILMSGMQRQASHAFLTGGAAAVIYAFLWKQAHPDGSFLDVSVTLRFPLLFVVAFFSSFFVHQLQEREGRLRSMQKRLDDSEKLAFVGRLAAGVAQEFFNLLSVVNGFCEQLASELGPEDTRLQLLDPIRQATARMVFLTHELLRCSRRHDANPSVIDLNRFITDRARPLQDLVGAGVSVSTTLSSCPPIVKADPELLQHVIFSLAANARDAMAGEGRLIIKVAAPGPADGFVRLSVSDTGSGLSPEVLPLLFEPFVTTKIQKGGVGLSLASAYGIVKQLGGDISVASSPGAGTLFDIDLPAQLPPAS